MTLRNKQIQTFYRIRFCKSSPNFGNDPGRVMFFQQVNEGQNDRT